MSTFQCQLCGRSFTVPQPTLDKYPAWQPKQCLRCRGPAGQSAANSKGPGRQPGPATLRSGRGSRRAGRSEGAIESGLTLAEVLATYTDGPGTGVFTDGAAHPNPGPGGWGAVYVVDQQIIAQKHGSEAQTTNNRMELTALIEGYGLVPRGQSAVVLTDSQLCVDTINSWAAGWEKNGWKRKGGPIKNLDLVQQLYRIARDRPELELRWIRAHNGYRWNEYADALATAYRRATP
jgi:ribonuclease HI